MFEEPRGISAQCTTSYEAGMLRPTLGSRQVTLSSGKEEPSDVASHDT
jgi:hypothetical protein